ncbi:MAG: hypothetical protein HY595_02960 [Candidatus Omnitrophica bacterium]|nr:hypothetical protein [Candidatus Omnitrophota bacterium]
MWSHRHITKITLKNLPNLWGGLLLLGYVLQGLPFPQTVKVHLAARFGPAAPSRLSGVLHIGLGLVMSLAIFVPLMGQTAGFGIMSLMIVAVGTVLGAIGVAFSKLKDRLYEELGPVKYAIVIGLLLLMTGVLGKIVLRLLFGIKYVLSFPAFNFNI